jgi:chemotaxis protein methyltransferase CheR
MSPEEFRLIKEFVAEVFGLILEDSKKSFLAVRLKARLDELHLGTFTEYYTYLKFSPHNSQEQKIFISIITNNETYFFREEAQLKVLVENILPEVKAKKQREGNKSLRIVSAGCSSGEEVYTLAILLLESGGFFWDWEVRITGVDIDPQILAKAEAGVYCGRSFQTTPPHIIDRYFRKTEDGWEVKDILRKSTQFVQGNLLQFDRTMDGDDVDIIFCRNVLIYFSDETIKRIVTNFYRTLCREGLLFLGHSESLSRITTGYIPLRYPGAIVYKKRD